MPEEREGTEQPRQRYCGKCGALVRSESAFCTSCGVPVASGSEGTQQFDTSSPGQATPIDIAKEKLRVLLRYFGGVVTSSDNPFREAFRNAAKRLEDLPAALRLTLAGLGVFILLVVLSPLVLLAGVLLLGISVVNLTVRLVRGESGGRWGIVAVASLVFVLAFAGISNLLYGGFFGDNATSVDGPPYVGGSAPNKASADGGTKSPEPGLEGIDTSNPVWAFHVTCQQLEGNDELRSAVARDLAETVNTPRGPQAAIDSLERTLPRACRGVDPLYEPGTRALKLTEAEVGDN